MMTVCYLPELWKSVLSQTNKQKQRIHNANLFFIGDPLPGSTRTLWHCSVTGFSSPHSSGFRVQGSPHLTVRAVKHSVVFSGAVVKRQSVIGWKTSRYSKLCLWKLLTKLEVPPPWTIFCFVWNTQIIWSTCSFSGLDWEEHPDESSDPHNSIYSICTVKKHRRWVIKTHRHRHTGIKQPRKAAINNMCGWDNRDPEAFKKKKKNTGWQAETQPHWIPICSAADDNKVQIWGIRAASIWKEMLIKSRTDWGGVSHSWL